MPIFSKQTNAFLYIHIPKCAGSSILDLMTDLSDKVTLYYRDEKHDFPCNPQHFQQSLLYNLCSTEDISNSITIVRHPLLRLISEHSYRNALRIKSMQKSLSFSKDIRHFFNNYKYNNYIYDNHIRPQIEFIFPQTKVFLLETQYQEALLEMSKSLGEFSLDSKASMKRKNQSFNKNFIISKQDIALIQDFYHYDFEMFGYKKLALGAAKNISYDEVKQELLTAMTTKEYTYNQELVTDYFANKKQSYYRKIKQSIKRLAKIL